MGGPGSHRHEPDRDRIPVELAAVGSHRSDDAPSQPPDEVDQQRVETVGLLHVGRVAALLDDLERGQGVQRRRGFGVLAAVRSGLASDNSAHSLLVRPEPERLRGPS